VSLPILSSTIRYEQNVVAARQMAVLLGLNAQQQTRAWAPRCGTNMGARNALQVGMAQEMRPEK
jgi:hypothetical protein